MRYWPHRREDDGCLGRERVLYVSASSQPPGERRSINILNSQSSRSETFNFHVPFFVSIKKIFYKFQFFSVSSLTKTYKINLLIEKRRQCSAWNAFEILQVDALYYKYVWTRYMKIQNDAIYTWPFPLGYSPRIN